MSFAHARVAQSNHQPVVQRATQKHGVLVGLHFLQRSRCHVNHARRMNLLPCKPCHLGLVDFHGKAVGKVSGLGRLAPVQVVVATITHEADAYAGQVLEALKAHGLRAEADLRNEKIGYKVREHSLAKVPVMLVVGARESRDETVAIRRLGSQAQETVALRDAVATLKAEAFSPQPPAVASEQARVG